MDKRQRSQTAWNDAYARPVRDAEASDPWLDDFRALIAVARGPVIDLGCGGGFDAENLVRFGRQVIACDRSEEALLRTAARVPGITVLRFDMTEGLPFPDGSCDLMIADLSLHYFPEKETFEILRGIRRVLTPDGHLLFRVNSVSDRNFGAEEGEEIEPHLRLEPDGSLKRFFTADDIRHFFNGFIIEYMNEESMYRYRREKRLFRCCVKNSK